MRLIDADKFDDMLENLAKEKWNKSTTTSLAHAFDEIAGMVDHVPTVEAEPIKHGHWATVKSSTSPYFNDVKCSRCGVKMGSSFGYKYCPHCGAKMDEVTE